MQKTFLLMLCVLAAALVLGCDQQAPLEGDGNTALPLAKFDQFGYNYDANLFVGPADGVDRILDGKVWGDPTYANDHLVMKWSSAWWDGKQTSNWTPDAWENNEWNGQVPGGSGEVWHYKIVWVGADLQASPYWRENGYPIWGQFEVIFDHGTSENEHFWYAHSLAPGYGGF